MSDINNRIIQTQNESEEKIVNNHIEKDIKKPSMLQKLKNIFTTGTKKKESKKEEVKCGVVADDKILQVATAGQNDSEILSRYLGHIETQLDKVDEQNKLLLMHLASSKENNDLLIKQITELSKSNERLTTQFLTLKKREKVAKIIAIVASSLAIGFWVYQFIMILTN
ncbi:MAG: hypothetical protein FWC11_04225 [Firmicutes bacterium]|nr:hypothetical protein [Bacillota bacterium]MCL2256049.1 hypothetical protein [Bacillota bacterium]